MNTKERAYALIDLNALGENFRRIRKACQPQVKVLAAVKADAYGHGVIPVTRRLIAEGVDYLAVACYAEGAEIRQAFPDIPILVLGYVSEEELPLAITQNLTLTVYDEACGRAVSAAAQKVGKPAKIHIKLDSGMSRLGFVCERESVEKIASTLALPMLDAEGIFSHLAASECDEDYTRRQFDAFMVVCQGLSDKGITFTLKHICNSAAIDRYPEMHLDMVRAGISLYSPDCPGQEGVVRSVMTLCTTVADIRALKKGTDISYGRTYTLTRDSRIAVLPIGYADGLHRTLSNRAVFSVNGGKAPQIGRICMDQCMVDVTDLAEIKIGDSVIIFGEPGETVLGANGLAALCDTISYELLCSVSKRVPRRYLGE